MWCLGVVFGYGVCYNELFVIVGGVVVKFIVVGGKIFVGEYLFVGEVNFIGCYFM